MLVFLSYPSAAWQRYNSRFLSYTFDHYSVTPWCFWWISRMWPHPNKNLEPTQNARKQILDTKYEKMCTENTSNTSYYRRARVVNLLLTRLVYNSASPAFVPSHINTAQFDFNKVYTNTRLLIRNNNQWTLYCLQNYSRKSYPQVLFLQTTSVKPALKPFPLHCF